MLTFKQIRIIFFTFFSNYYYDLLSPQIHILANTDIIDQML